MTDTGASEWAEVRAGAVRAVIQAASDFGHDGLVAGDAGQLADAVLGVCDSAAIRLLEEAFHLHMNGEYALGGNETWRDWDRRCETFLRSLTPPPAGSRRAPESR
jgi:hypothetical protein